MLKLAQILRQDMDGLILLEWFYKSSKALKQDCNPLDFDFFTF